VLCKFIARRFVLLFFFEFVKFSFTIFANKLRMLRCLCSTSAKPEMEISANKKEIKKSINLARIARIEQTGV